MPDTNESSGGIVVPSTENVEQLLDTSLFSDVFNGGESNVTKVVTPETATVVPEESGDGHSSPDIILEPIEIPHEKHDSAVEEHDSPVDQEHADCSVDDEKLPEDGSFTPVTDQSPTPEIQCRPSSASPATLRPVESPRRSMQREERQPMSFRELTAEFDSRIMIMVSRDDISFRLGQPGRNENTVVY
eukprot:sb/3471268/